MDNKFPDVEVMDFRKALEWVYLNSGNPKNKKYAIISIQESTNGYGLGLEFKKGGNCLAALNIEFDDCTPAVKRLGDVLISKNDAQKIHDFVEMLPTEVELLIVQCRAGMSRSCSVAEAIRLVKTGHNNLKNARNKYVYYFILETYGMENLYWKDYYENEKETIIDIPKDIPDKIKRIMDLVGEYQS